MRRLLGGFFRDEHGGQMAEYAILLMIALFVAAAVFWFGGVIQGAFNAVVDGISSGD